MRQRAGISMLHQHLHDTEKRWFAVQTRAKCEKLIQRQLMKKGVDAYVPLQAFVRRYDRKSRTVELPLIPSYVFVHINKTHYLPVLETENVTGFVKLAGVIIPIPENEIDTLRRITLEKTTEVQAVKGRFEAGDTVEITAGYLAGFKGCLVKEAGKRRLQVELHHLGYSLLITVEAHLLEHIRYPAGMPTIL